METTEREQIKDAWKDARQAMSDMANALGHLAVAAYGVGEIFQQGMIPVFKVFAEYLENAKRAHLYVSLPRWIPACIRAWIADKCPKRWLPNVSWMSPSDDDEETEEETE